MHKITPDDFKCPVCHDDLTGMDPTSKDYPGPTVLIETCGEYIHQNCIEAMVLAQLEDKILMFLSNKQDSLGQFRTAGRKYLTQAEYFEMTNVIRNHKVHSLWIEVKKKGELDVNGPFYVACAPDELDQCYRKDSSVLTTEEIQRSLGDIRDQFYGKDEWTCLKFISFGVRLVCKVAMAMFCEMSIHFGVWVQKNVFEAEVSSDQVREMREANVARRLLPLFKEYWGIKYNQFPKDPVETKAWKWIVGKVKQN
ncbi:MAG: CRISPR-associated endonuclease Cas2 [Simkaniaceae bacterium]|nr:CRISPR-associated endonuclease Cas2 [Simkaniaceae bacterium]